MMTRPEALRISLRHDTRHAFAPWFFANNSRKTGGAGGEAVPPRHSSSPLYLLPEHFCIEVRVDIAAGEDDEGGFALAVELAGEAGG